MNINCPYNSVLVATDSWEFAKTSTNQYLVPQTTQASKRREIAELITILHNLQRLNATFKNIDQRKFKGLVHAKYTKKNHSPTFLAPLVKDKL